MELRKNDLLVVLLRVVSTLYIKLEEAVEKDLACLYIELLFRIAACHLDVGLQHLCVCHLGCYGALPYQFIESLLLWRTLDGRIARICRSYGLVSLLCPFCLGLVLPCL